MRGIARRCEACGPLARPAPPRILLPLEALEVIEGPPPAPPARTPRSKNGVRKPDGDCALEITPAVALEGRGGAWRGPAFLGPYFVPLQSGCAYGPGQATEPGPVSGSARQRPAKARRFVLPAGSPRGREKRRAGIAVKVHC